MEAEFQEVTRGLGAAHSLLGWTRGVTSSHFPGPAEAASHPALRTEATACR